MASKKTTKKAKKATDGWEVVEGAFGDEGFVARKRFRDHHGDQWVEHWKEVGGSTEEELEAACAEVDEAWRLKDLGAKQAREAEAKELEEQAKGLRDA